ncbi:MAG: radical SAM protein [Candidatus Omnitrophica bacterium]|nr:radical SAM protein [Candidatus Omnitrophota bacterium]MBU3934030.1 radical SAM protein [Candidatus Omnitrophota bacterium]
MPKLKEVIISITNRCNLKCKMCDIPYEKKEELTAAHWKRVIKDASFIGAETIVFSGGEPLLREDIFDLVSFVKNNRMKVCLTSNGCLIDKDVASRLAYLKVDVVNISVEGLKETHDYLRGENTFDRAVSALENLKKCGIESTIATVVSRYNYVELPYIVKLAAKYGATTIRFQPFSKIFVEDKKKEGSFFIDREDKKKLQGIAEELIEFTNRCGISTNPASYLRAIPSYLSGKSIIPHDSCSALWSSCSINVTGEIFPCWAIGDAQKQIGNVQKDSLRELWDSPRHNQIRESIAKEGCPGCMMSCYDEVFGRDGKTHRILFKLNKIRITPWKRLITKFIYRLRNTANQIESRYRFYKSYHGPLRNIFNRVLKNARKRRAAARNINIDNNIDKALEKIRLLEKAIKKELKL